MSLARKLLITHNHLGMMGTKPIAATLASGLALVAFVLPVGTTAGRAVVTPMRPPSIDPSRPLIVTVRGWLWEPSSRPATPKLERFPTQVAGAMQSGSSLTPQIVQFEWSRVPKDVFDASSEFGRFADGLSAQAAAAGRCVAYVGHSAGAAIAWWAAASGVRMGYLGTLGLPTFGKSKPETVDMWANFYTSSHVDDVAGRLWGSQMQADVNVDLRMRHKDFWESEEVAAETAAGVAETWNC